MTTAPLRAARATGLLLSVLCAGSPAAFAISPPGAYQGAPSPAVVHVAAVGTRVSLCPCNAGMPDGPAAIGTRTATVGELRSGGGRPQDVSARVRHSQATSGQRALPASHGEGFDFADASVGAGAAVAAVFLVAGAARTIGRRRWHAELTAGSRR